MTTIYDAKGPEELRAAVVALCADIALKFHQHWAERVTRLQDADDTTQFAQRHVPPVPLTLPMRWEAPLTGSTPLYRHPATEADALAMLVAAGWKSIEHAHDVYGLGWNVTMRSNPRRVLVAPLGAAYE